VDMQAFVPLVTYPAANSDALAANAVAIAAQVGASLHAFALNADIPPISNAFSHVLLNVPDMIREAEGASRKRGEHLLEAVRTQAAAAGVTATMTALTAQPVLLCEVAASHARYFDFSLLGWEAGNQTAEATAEAVVFGSGRPAILLPEKGSAARIDHVVIAWDGSRVAARAVADAQPFLARAAKVSVLTVVDEKPLKEKNAAERLAEGLRQRGLAAEAAEIRADKRPIAEVLQKTAIERGGNLLVMGGYGHSRLRDFVLGGATKGVLDELLLPALLSH